MSGVRTTSESEMTCFWQAWMSNGATSPAPAASKGVPVVTPSRVMDSWALQVQARLPACAVHSAVLASNCVTVSVQQRPTIEVVWRDEILIGNLTTNRRHKQRREIHSPRMELIASRQATRKPIIQAPGHPSQNTDR